MSLKKDIVSQRMMLRTHKNKNKLVKRVSERYLETLLNRLERNADYVYIQLGEMIVEHIRQEMLATTPTGKRYELIGDEIREYRASSDGELPGTNYSGTLVDSIDFRIIGGELEIGVFDSPGTEYSSTSYRSGGSSEGIHGTITIEHGGEGTPVTEYAKFLEEGTSRMEARPWLEPLVRGLKNYWRIKAREIYKQYVREQTKNKLVGQKQELYIQVLFK